LDAQAKSPPCRTENGVQEGEGDLIELLPWIFVVFEYFKKNFLPSIESGDVLYKMRYIMSCGVAGGP